MKQTIVFKVLIDVDADAASRLPGFPGENWGDEVAEPVSGIEIESDIICDELLKIVMERLPARLKAHALHKSVQVSAPFDPAIYAIK